MRGNALVDILFTPYPLPLTPYPLRLTEGCQSSPIVEFAVVQCLTHNRAFNFWSDEWKFSADGERWILLILTIYPVGFALLSLHFFILSLLGLDKQVMDIHS